MTEAAPRPILWSIAGTDSGGGAGLSADARAAAAFGVHLCPVVAAVTAQNSTAVTHLQPIGVAALEQQLAALADDLPPAAIKTGLLGNAEQVRCVAHWVRQLRRQQPALPLVIDPVLRASTGADWADAELLAAYRSELLPLASLVTPNQAEAERLGITPHGPAAYSLCITGGDSPNPDWALDWVRTPEANGWMALPKRPALHNHGTGCTFASAAAAALARDFCPADALILAKMLTSHALAHGYAAGAGAGPVAASPDFLAHPEHFPSLSWDAQVALPAATSPSTALPDTIYAITDRLDRLEQLLQAGVRLLQLRIKHPSDWPQRSASAQSAWLADTEASIRQAVTAARSAGATLYINDHLELALAAGAQAIHLGQEDYAGLSPSQRQRLHSSGVQLGISSHSLWELARSRSLGARYIACGPVWATTTKDMPWQPQGLDNLHWWVRMAQAPVVAIGGILQAEQASAVAATGAAAACLVRGIGADPHASIPSWRQAFAAGAAQPRPTPQLPHSPLLTPPPHPTALP